MEGWSPHGTPPSPRMPKRLRLENSPNDSRYRRAIDPDAILEDNIDTQDDVAKPFSGGSRTKGSQSLNGIWNKDTISKDNTEGHEAEMDNLLATIGRKMMGIKDKEQHNAASQEHAKVNTQRATRLRNERSPSPPLSVATSISPTLSPPSPWTPPRDLVTYSDKHEDVTIEASERSYILPKRPRSEKNI